MRLRKKKKVGAKGTGVARRKVIKVPNLKARWAKISPEPIPKEQVQLVSKLIRGE